MELLEREMRRPNPLSMSSLTISSTNSVASTHANSTAILKSVLSQKEICDFRELNSFKTVWSEFFAREYSSITALKRLLADAEIDLR